MGYQVSVFSDEDFCETQGHVMGNVYKGGRIQRCHDEHVGFIKGSYTEFQSSFLASTVLV